MKKILTLLATAMLAVGLNAQELTVAEGNKTSDQLPIYGFYGDTGFENQFIYPASLLEDMDGNKIQSLLFYSALENVEFPGGEITIRLAEVAYTTLSDNLVDMSDAQTVYKGAFNVTDNKLECAFSTPFEYKGGNLLVDVALTTLSSKYPTTSFYGIDAADNGLNSYKSGSRTLAYIRDFLPKATFTYEVSGSGSCANPTRVKGTATPDGSVFTWNGAEDVKHQYCVVAHDAEPAGWTDIDANVFTCTVTGLNAGTDYDFCLRADCGSEQSAVVRIAFTPVCNAPANLQVSDITSSAAKFAWEAVEGISRYQYICVEEGAILVWAEAEPKEGLTAEINGLDPNTAYEFYVRSYFSADIQSQPVKIAFTTDCDAKELPFREAFMSEELPDCWEIENQGSDGWRIFTGDGEMTKCMCYVNARNRPGTTDILRLPTINLSLEAEIKLTVQNISLNVNLFITKENGETEEVYEFTPSGEDPVEVTVDLTAYRGLAKLHFEATSVAGRSAKFYFDNLQVKKAEVPDGVDNTDAPAQATKRIANGKLLIERNGVLYNAQGTIVK